MSDKPKADPWLRPHDDKLRNLLRGGHVSSSDTRRPTLIAIAQEHFPTTFIAGDKKSVDNRVKLLRRKINNYRLGNSKEGARQGQGRSVMLLLLCIYTSSTDTSLFVHHLSTDTADNYEDEDFDEEDYEDDDDNIMGSSKQPAPAKPRKEPPEEDMAGLTAAMQKLATEQPYTPFPNYVSLPAFLGEEVYDFNGHKYINVNFLGLASFGSHNYLFKVVDHGLALECTTLLPPRFYNIERFFDMYHLDINNERSWQDPRIISWMSTVGQVREMYPSMDLIPSYPPMKVVLPEKCDTRIVSQDMLFTSGCNVVYNELANQGNPSPHQLMATCNCRLLATKKQHNANIWTTRATSGAMTPPKQHTHFQPGGAAYTPAPAPYAPAPPYAPVPPAPPAPAPPPVAAPAAAPVPPPPQAAPPVPPPPPQAAPPVPPPPPQAAPPVPPPRAQNPAAAAAAAAAMYRQYQQQHAQGGTNGQGMGPRHVPQGLFAEQQRTENRRSRDAATGGATA